MSALASDESLDRRRHPPTWAAAALAAALLIVVGSRLLAGGSGNAIHEAVSEGRAAAAPEFDLEIVTAGDLGGAPRRWWRVARDGRVSLDELRRFPVVINFWSSRCAVCRLEALVLERAARDAGHDVLILGIGSGQTREEVGDRVHALGMSFPQVYDRGGHTARRWAVDGVPETFFVARGGEIVGHVVGTASAADVRAGVAAAVEGRPGGLRSGGRREAIE